MGYDTHGSQTSLTTFRAGRGPEYERRVILQDTPALSEVRKLAGGANNFRVGGEQPQILFLARDMLTLYVL